MLGLCLTGTARPSWVRIPTSYQLKKVMGMLTNLEIVERALKRIADPDWEFKESVILLLASKLATEQSTNKSEIDNG